MVLHVTPFLVSHPPLLTQLRVGYSGSPYVFIYTSRTFAQTLSFNFTTYILLILLISPCKAHANHTSASSLFSFS
jgi:hypothetical protein